MTVFYPALADTDNIGYFDNEGRRRLMSIRRLFSPRTCRNILVSLSYNEKIHYLTSNSDYDQHSPQPPDMARLESVFADCGAFHYSSSENPAFRGGGFVTALTAWEKYSERHLEIQSDCSSFLLCSPDHIIAPEMDDASARRRTEFTLSNASEFIDFVEDDSRVTPVGVAHGRNAEERAAMTRELIEMGFHYIAFGGLVPLATKHNNVISQLTGSKSLDSPIFKIKQESALGIAREAGVKTHLFGLNSPDWYRWIKRLGVDSFDGSKLSQEGAKNGIIWIENDPANDHQLTNANGMYRKLRVKGLEFERTNENGELAGFEFDGNSISMENPGWNYLLSSRCTSSRCVHGPETHNCDPRVFGSIEHNMGRSIVNSWTFESIMGRIDKVFEEAKNSDDDNLVENWSPIEVE